MDNILKMRGPDPESAPLRQHRTQCLLHYSPLLLYHYLSLVSVSRGTILSVSVRVRMLMLRIRRGRIGEIGRKDSLVDEEARYMRARELAAGHLDQEWRFLRGAPLRMHILLWELLSESLMIMRVSRN